MIRKDDFIAFSIYLTLVSDSHFIMLLLFIIISIYNARGQNMFYSSPNIEHGGFRPIYTQV